MLRIFTKDVGRFRKGDVKEYTLGTWLDIARSAKIPLESFSDITGESKVQAERAKASEESRKRIQAEVAKRDAAEARANKKEARA